MIRKPTLGRQHSTARRPAALRLEPLEVRQMLDAAFINEIYIDPPSGGDAIHEYIELRGTPGMSLDNHYLLIIENENNAQNTGAPGEIEKIFDLTGKTMGENGFLTFRQAGNSYTVADGTNDLTYTGSLENSGFTAMLVKTDGLPANVPQLNFDLDVGNNGLDLPNGHAGWTILDSIGIHGELGEAAFGRLYGKINFGPEASTNIEPGAVYVGVGYEIEYIGRWGNSTGQTAADWHVSNLTDSAQSGFTNTGDFRQSADPQGSVNVESNKNVPYGTNLTNTLGAPNLGSPTDVFINEIYFDPPSGGDSIHEYIELRGTPNMSLNNYYLVIVENENDIFNEGGAGEIEKVFDLTGQSLGSNGFLVFRQSGNSYTVAPGTTNLAFTGMLENSGFTAMLVRNNGGAASVPVVNELTPRDLDVGNNGLDVASGDISWDVMDSVGLHSEIDEIEFGMLYGAANFGPGPSGVNLPYYYNVGFEIEYIGRWGNSTGNADTDWHVSNLTDNALSGFTNTGDFRQSADPHGSANVESNQNVAYGTNLTNTLGAPNLPLNVPTNSTVADRHIFYNQSGWDGNSAAISPANDALAIATDKDAYIPGSGTAVFANMTSFTRGVNGIMVDLSAGVTHTGITAADFVFKVGNNNTPSGWAAAPAPSAISVVPGGGVGGSDRVIITWASASIANKWLEVQVLATANTGLAAADVHFWGNKIGDTANFAATTADSAQVFANLGAGKPITDTRDFNRDKSVTTADSVQVFANLGSIVAINIPGGGPFAPEAEPAVAGDGGSSAVASALAAKAGPSGLPKIVEQFATRLGSVELNGSAVAKVLGPWGANDSTPIKSLASGVQQSKAWKAVDLLLESLLDEIELA